MVASFSAEVVWERAGAAFTDGGYSRRHRWRFDQGLEVPASAAPSSVAPPLSAEDAVDPEEAFIASLASCHMLFFLALAAKKGLVIDRYVDRPDGALGRGPTGRQRMALVTLRPEVAFHGAPPPAATVERLHHMAHDLCYIANSVTTEIRIEPRAPGEAGGPMAVAAGRASGPRRSRTPPGAEPPPARPATRRPSK